MSTTLEILKEYIRDEFGYPDEIDPDIDLLDARILDSFSIVQIAVFIQDKFGLELEAEDIARSNLAKLTSMIELIEKHKAKQGN
jgi:acyl carrier protein